MQTKLILTACVVSSALFMTGCHDDSTVPSSVKDHTFNVHFNSGTYKSLAERKDNGIVKFNTDAIYETTIGSRRTGTYSPSKEYTTRKTLAVFVMPNSKDNSFYGEKWLIKFKFNSADKGEIVSKLIETKRADRKPFLGKTVAGKFDLEK